MQLPPSSRRPARVVPGREHRHRGLPVPHHRRANLLIAHGSRSRSTCGRPMVEGRYFGTMCLSEPQAGSSLADITTRAEPRRRHVPAHRQQDVDLRGRPRAGREHRPPGAGEDPRRPAGVKGISLFVVPRFLVGADGSRGERNDVALAGLNHKMGYRGTVNTLLNFGEGRHTPGGEPGRRGLPGGRAAPRPRLHVPHDERGARRRRRGSDRARLHRLPARPGLRPHPPAGPRRSARRTPSHRRSRSSSTPTSRRMLLAQKSLRRGRARAGPLLRPAARRGAHGADAGASAPGRTCCWTCSRRSRRAGRRSGAWTPTTWRSRCTAATATRASTPSSSSTATTGSTPIHEGTHGIQGLDLLGRKVVMNGGAGLSPAAGDDRGDRRPGQRRAGGEAAELADALDTPRRGSQRPRPRCGRPGTRADPGQRVGLPGGRRARGGGLDLAGAAARAAGTATTTSTRASGGGPVLLPLRAAADRPAVRRCWPTWTAPPLDVRPEWF